MKSQRPVLRLDDGTTMLLDSLKGDSEEAGILRKEDRRINICLTRQRIYHSKRNSADNTIEVPKGAEFDLDFVRWYPGLVECRF